MPGLDGLGSIHCTVYHPSGSAVTKHRRNDEERGENCVHFTDEEEEVGKVTSHLSSWLESRMPTFYLKALIGLQGCSKGDLFLGTRAPREQEGIIDSQEATRTESLEFFCCQC